MFALTDYLDVATRTSSWRLISSGLTGFSFNSCLFTLVADERQLFDFSPNVRLKFLMNTCASHATLNYRYHVNVYRSLYCSPVCHGKSRCFPPSALLHKTCRVTQIQSCHTDTGCPASLTSHMTPGSHKYCLFSPASSSREFISLPGGKMAHFCYSSSFISWSQLPVSNSIHTLTNTACFCECSK